MVINKTYNIEQLAETLQQAIELSKKYNGIVKLDILTAHDILEVIKETHKREQKHQTLESALTFIEKEDGTQSNSMELSEVAKYCDCFGSYKGVGNQKCFLCCLSDTCKDKKVNKQTATNSLCVGGQSERPPKCLGKYEATKNVKCVNVQICVRVKANYQNVLEIIQI